MTEIVRSVIEWYMANLNYLTIALLMMVESTVLPMPSEVVIPFAAYKAAQGQLHVVGIFLAGTTGALAGSLINYSLALFLGRPIIYGFADTRVAHLLLVTRQKVIHAENYFLRNGNSSTFIGRLVPGIRHLISIPAGLAKMKMKSFFFYTFAGAGLWNIVLILVGFFAYEMKDLLLKYIGHILIGLGILFVLYLVWAGWRRKNRRIAEK
jgi:membrane protein DedA with SNARE-associated domain